MASLFCLPQPVACTVARFPRANRTPAPSILRARRRPMDISASRFCIRANSQDATSVDSVRGSSSTIPSCAPSDWKPTQCKRGSSPPVPLPTRPRYITFPWPGADSLGAADMGRDKHAFAACSSPLESAAGARVPGRGRRCLVDRDARGREPAGPGRRMSLLACRPNHAVLDRRIALIRQIREIAGVRATRGVARATGRDPRARRAYRPASSETSRLRTRHPRRSASTVLAARPAHAALAEPAARRCRRP